MNVATHGRLVFGRRGLFFASDCRAEPADINRNAQYAGAQRLMKTLQVILDDALQHVCADNATILNDEQFRCIRGPSSRVFRQRLDAALFGPGDLVEVEARNASDGLEVISPVRGGIHGGFWYLRNVSGRGEQFPAGEGQYASIVEALEAAIEWWEAEAWCRSVMVRKFYCDETDRSSSGSMADGE
jgi:hypothetical protein